MEGGKCPRIKRNSVCDTSQTRNGYPAYFNVGGNQRNSMATDNGKLSMTEVGVFIDILERDDVESLKNFLKERPQKERTGVLTAPLVYVNFPELERFHQQENVILTVPVHIACAFSSFAVLSALLELGVDILQTAENGDNVVHVLIDLANRKPSKEKYIVGSYKKLCSLIGPQKIKKLLFMEDENSLRPLELAAKHGLCVLVRTIMQTDGVYLTRQQKCGITWYQWYDVTEYEFCGMEGGGRRHDRSPLAFLGLMENEKLADPTSLELFQWGPIVNWCRAKERANNPPLFLWFLLRCLYVVAYYVLESGLTNARVQPQGQRNESFGGNTTESVSTYALTRCVGTVNIILTNDIKMFLVFYLLFHSSVILIHIAFEIIRFTITRKPVLLNTLWHRKNVGVSVRFYATCQAILSTGVIIAISTEYMSLERGAGYQITGYIRIVNALMAVWSILQFFQLFNAIGYFIRAVQHMLTDLVYFSVLYVAFLLPFSHLFGSYIQQHSNDGCVDTFHGFFYSFYSTFKIMLNMVDVLSHVEENNYSTLIILHVVYVFLMAILLVNFLIAKMSSSVSVIEENQVMVTTLERLYLHELAEYRLSRVLACYYRRVNGSCFTVENGRLYLLHCELLTDNNNTK